MEKDTIFTLIKNLKSKQSRQVLEKIKKIANINTNILIYGETGAGKDFWVNYLYEISNAERLLNLNCGDVPENLLESEWFGYKKGAFTGADRDYEGKWRKATNGILFLNQIDMLSLNLQSRLLRIIERKKYYPLGSNQEIGINVRFVFSTDSDIEEKVRKGEFRDDLFYRISAYKIFIPPLRERKNDILPLIRYFAKKKNMKIKLSPDGINTLLKHAWRGNIREIENLVNNVSITGDALTDENISGFQSDSEVLFKTQMDADVSLDELEREYIGHLLKKYKNKARVAKILKISRKSLYNKLKKYAGH